MFRNQPLRTYQRKKASGFSSTNNLTSITRETVPENKKLQPEDMFDSKDNAVSMEYDPFDTTFDRLARDTKLPPIPPDRTDDSSYSKSSEAESSLSDSETSNCEDLAPLRDPSPLINPKPATQRRNYKKRKLNKEVVTVGLKKFGKQVGSRVYQNDSSMDENTEPNIEREKLGKRGGKKKDSEDTRNATNKTRRRVAVKPAIFTYRGMKDKNINTDKSLKRCSVSLTRVSLPLDKSMAALNLENKSLNDKKNLKESVVPGFSNAETRVESAKDTSTSSRDEKILSTLKNSIVSLTRLKVPQCWPSIANKSWLNSTPIGRRIGRPKSPLRFSPIRADKSVEITDRHEDGSYDGQRLPPEKSVVQSKDLTPKNSKPSNLSEQLEKNSTDSRPHILSDTPDPEPSGLMFEDTEIPPPLTDSYANVLETGNKYVADASTTSPFMGFSRDSEDTPLEDSRPAFRAILAPTVNYSDSSETLPASPLERYKKDSTDSGSLHLTIEGSDKTATSSKELTRSLEKTRPDSRASSASTENRTGVTDTASFRGLAEGQQNSSKKRLKNRQNSLEENAKDEQNSLEDSAKDEQNCLVESSKYEQHSLEESAKDEQNSLEESANDEQNSLEESAKDEQNSLVESAKDQYNSSEERSKDTSARLNSDDDWTTILDSPRGDSSNEKIPQNTTADSSKRKSIVQVSSDDDNTSCDDIGEFVNVRESSRQMKFDSQELTSFEVDSKVGAISESKPRAVESSVVEISYNKKLLKDPRSWTQPVVLLSRVCIPNVKNTRLESPADSMKSIQETSSENDDTNAENSVNESQVASEFMEWKGSENEGSQESQNDMESLKIDEVSGNTTEAEESAIMEVSQPDLSKGSFRWSMTEVGNGNESFEAAEVSVTKSQLKEETSTKILDEDAPEDSRRSIQPIVLLTRLNDPVRITDRRKKYRNWGLSAISENLKVKNVTTIEEQLEELETTDTVKSEAETEETEKEPRKEEIETEPKIKLSGDGETETMISQGTTVSWDSSVLSNQGHDSIKDEKMVFLKPGKSWSRSLSLYRQVHNQEDLESLAFGKGKKWRQSVQNMLDMQQHGVIQSCVKKNEDDKESRSCYGVRNSGAGWIPGCSHLDTSRVFSQSSVGSPGRFVRRVSIRVVPDSKNSELYEDSPFLEAYGITSSENRKTLGKRSTLIAPRKTVLYNVQCQDVTFESIPNSLNSVTSRDLVLAQCGQESSVPFDECYPDSYLKHCRKIGEGVFGEVFLYEKGAETNVIKIIPIEGELKVNGERQKKFVEILSEIVIAKELNNLRFADTCKTSSFVEVKNIRCVVGKYPRMLVNLWKTYDDERNSENDCPDMFDKNQLYIVLELGHGGQDLEAFIFQNASEAHALFTQTALALAVAEESLEFEHRDLHWGNILISRTEDSQIDYKLRDKDISVASKGVKVSVIDFTLSRMSYQHCSIFNDLSLDDDLFAAQGEYQFEIYRLMRQKVENNWQTFEPYTNVLWLHYTLDKMITAVRYRRITSKIHKNAIGKLKELKNEILSYNSAFDFVTNCDNMTRLQGSRSRVSKVTSTD